MDRILRLRWLGRLARWSVPAVALLYVAVTLAMTWPLVRGLATDLPGDLGDSLLNCYLLGWGAEHLLAALRGDLSALGRLWHAGIFHPEPYALTYSEHLLAQAIQVLPVYVLTGNLILCYTLLFLSTFVLSGLGTFLLVRALTGSPRAAFVAGLFYAFAPYRVAQYTHLQVLSAEWMPFVLFGLRRYLDTQRVAPLAGAVLALVAQNLSCGYFLVYFPPFVLLYVLYELADRRLASNWRVWRALGLAGLTAGLLTLPFVLPYLELRQQGLLKRGVEEVRFFSADLLSYGTAAPAVRWWGSLARLFDKPEGELFPGATPVALAALAVVWHGQRLRGRLPEAPQRSRARTVATAAAATVALVYLLAFAASLVTDRLTLGPFATVRLRHKWRLLLVAAGGGAALVALAPRLRRLLRGEPGSPLGFFLIALAAAVVLSFGPVLSLAGAPRLDPMPYQLLYEYVPGFDGLRVPARFSMLVALFLAVLAGLGAAALDRRGGALARAAVLTSGVVFLVEAAAIPIPINVTGAVDGYATPPLRVYPVPRAPAVYHFLRTLPADAVIVELPFGVYAYDLRYVYYATVHWRRLVNGYSGHFPPSYYRRKSIFARPFDHPDEAWQELAAAGTTHVVLHERAYLDDEGIRTAAWLRERGAREVASLDGDRVFQLPRPR